MNIKEFEKTTLEENLRNVFLMADKMSEEAVKIASKGSIAIDKEELYKEIYPRLIIYLLKVEE